MPDSKAVLTIAREMWEQVHDRQWKTASIEEQRRWCNWARSALVKAHVE